MILFLDIDGVLNTSTLYHGEEPVDLWPIQPHLLRNLERLVTELDCQVVISSSWRILNDREFFIEKLGPIVAPRIHENWRTDRTGEIRGLEVRLWIEKNIENPWQFKDYIILDDDCDFLWHQPLILVHPTAGLSDDIVDLAIASRGVRKYDM